MNYDFDSIGAARKVRGSKVALHAEDAFAAIGGLADGGSLAVGGFGLCGIPDVLIDAVLTAGASSLTVYSNNCGVDGKGLGKLLDAGRLTKVVASYVGENKEFARQFLEGELEVELTPQGTLAEKLRAGGSGIAAFFTEAGVGTQVAEGGLPRRYDGEGGIAVASEPKEVRELSLGGEATRYVLEDAVRPDVSIVHAATADLYGNLVFNRSARNFSPPVAMAGRRCIAQVERLVDPGDLDPDAVHLPGIYVDRIVFVGPDIDKDIEKRTVADRDSTSKEA